MLIIIGLSLLNTSANKLKIKINPKINKTPKKALTIWAIKILDSDWWNPNIWKNFLNRLPEEQFLRIHKSYIVNLDKVDRFNSKNVEVGAYEIPLSRNKKTQLVDALNNI